MDEAGGHSFWHLVGRLVLLEPYRAPHGIIGMVAFLMFGGAAATFLYIMCTSKDEDNPFRSCGCAGPLPPTAGLARLCEILLENPAAPDSAREWSARAHDNLNYKPKAELRAWAAELGASAQDMERSLYKHLRRCGLAELNACCCPLPPPCHLPRP